MGARYFTRDEATALLPFLSLELARVGQLRPEIAELTDELGGAAVALRYLEGEQLAPPPLARAAERLLEITAEIRGLVERVAGLGVIIEDLDQGLIDFYGHREGKAVFLCWQFGEPEVGHWHELDEGFGQRLPFRATRAAGQLN